MKRIKTISALRKLFQEHGDNLFIRWSRGPFLDQKRGYSVDQTNAQHHIGLSAVQMDEFWFDHGEEYLVRRLNEYRFLRLKDSLIRPYIMVGKQIGTDSDGYSSIEITGECFRLCEPLVKM